MSYDVQFISLVDELQILQVEEFVDAVPRAIRLVGRGGFSSAQRVIINDFSVDTFTVVNDYNLLVSPPSQFDALTINQMSFQVVSGSYTGGRQARLIFGPTKNVRKVAGLQKLVQQVVKVFLSNSNSNKFNIGEGGNLLRTLGETLSPSAKARISASVAQAVSQTEEQVRAAQINYRGLSSSEKLLSFKLAGVSFLEDNQEVRATVTLVTYAGRSIDIPLTL